MRRIRRILVAVKDPTAKALPALEKAGQLARALDAELVLFHAFGERPDLEADVARPGGLTGSERRMRAAAVARLAAPDRPGARFATVPRRSWSRRMRSARSSSSGVGSWASAIVFTAAVA